ncbi:MAG TPA: AI-2E family transporter, partial [Thermoanaerobaculia bacterium]|nr:AI-2E family transporter [Thermoanaerobaculia bacterium]
MNDPKKDLVRTVLQVLFVGLLIGASFWILRVFIGAVVWATMIAVSTWPLMRALERFLFGKRKLAVAGMTVVLLGAVLGPFLGAVAAIVANVDDIAAFARKLPAYQLPPAPAFLRKIPLAGAEISRLWDQAATAGVPALLKEASPYVGDVARWFASRVGSVSALLVELLLTIVIAAVMYAKGETAAQGLRAFARRLAGPRGEGVVDLAGGAIRGVAMGVVLTALVQSILAGAGLLVAGVPALLKEASPYVGDVARWFASRVG